MAFHPEDAGDETAALRYAATAAHRAAELGAHREAAAQFERALRFCGSADPATLAGLYEGLADELPLLDRWADANAAAERALALWREAGDRLREGGALRRLSRIQWNLYRGREAAAAAEAAISVLEALGPSVELARAYATSANQRMLHADHDAAIDLAPRAQDLAARLGAADVRSDALNTHAACLSAKDLEWAGQMRHALDIALSGGYQTQAARAYSNLCGIHADKREFAEAERYLAEGIAYCDEHDLTTYAFCLRGSQARLVAERFVTMTASSADATDSRAASQVGMVRLSQTITDAGPMLPGAPRRVGPQAARPACARPGAAARSGAALI